jgi:hypothetical protein
VLEEAEIAMYRLLQLPLLTFHVIVYGPPGVVGQVYEASMMGWWAEATGASAMAAAPPAIMLKEAVRATIALPRLLPACVAGMAIPSVSVRREPKGPDGGRRPSTSGWSIARTRRSMVGQVSRFEREA